MFACEGLTIVEFKLGTKATEAAPSNLQIAC